MRLAWLTDLHLDGVDEPVLDAFFGELDTLDVDAALVGGDVGESGSLEGYLVRLQASLDGPIYFVLGNHDHFGGTFASARAVARSIGERHAVLHWLPACEPIPLGEGVGLVGHGLWPDARLGDWEGSSLEFKDATRIEDLPIDRGERRMRMDQLGREAADLVREQLTTGFDLFEELWFLSHVPAFREACWQDDLDPEQADQWLPHFTCWAAGEVLREVLSSRPDRRITVLCGHTHGQRECQILPNLRVWTGSSESGKPAVERILDLSTGDGTP